MKPPAQPVPLPITPEQLREARAVLGWSLDRLAARSDTTVHIVNQYERIGRVASKLAQPSDFDALASIRAALEGAGVKFMNGDELGVKLMRQPK